MREQSLVRAISGFFFVTSLLFSGGLARASQGMATLIQMPRVFAMGGAGVGLADDEYALFLNPAGLAGQDVRKLRILGLGAEATMDTYQTLSTSLSGLKDFSAATLNTLMGKDIYLRSSIVPMLQLPKFAVSYFGDLQGGIEQLNQANPNFNLTNMVTHGVQAGTGWSYKKGRRAKDEWRFGIAGKMLWRRGGYYENVPFIDITNGGQSYLASLVGEYGTGFGADAGVQYVNQMNRKEEIRIGASVTDIGGVAFSSPKALRIKMNPSVGIAYRNQSDFMKMKFAFDLRNLDQDVSFVNKTHFGADFSFPLLNLYAGLNQLNTTFGAAFDLWILRVSALSYAEERGVEYRQRPSRRYLLQIDFSIPI